MQPTLVLPPSKNTENTSEDKNTIKIIEFNTARNGNNDDDNNNNNNVVTNNQTISEPLTVEEKKEKDGGGDEKKVVEKEQIFSPVSALIQTPQPPPPPLLHLSSSSSAKKVVDRVLKSDPTLRPSSLSEPVLIDEAKLEEKEKKEDMYKNLKVEESFEKSEKSLVKKSSGHHNSHFLDDELSIDLDSDSDSVLSFFDEQEKQN
jgi:hypothetical protein